MFKSKKKIEFNDEELRIIIYSLTEFRNQALNESKNADGINEVIAKSKNKMKVDKYDLGIMINGLNQRRKTTLAEDGNTTVINELLSKLLEVYKDI